MSFDYDLNKSLVSKLYADADAAVPGDATYLVDEFVNRWGQNALSVAIALQISPLVRQILDTLGPEDMPALLECIDEGSWTALDHAAICPDTNYYARLKELMGNRNLKVKMAPSTSFLRKTAELSRKVSNFRFNFLDPQNRLHQLTSAQAIERIPFSVKPERLDYFTYGTPEVLFEMWNHVSVMAIKGAPYIVEDEEELTQYFDFVERVIAEGIIPEIAFKKITHSDGKNPVEVGIGVVAVADIPANRIIMEYGGRYVIEDEAHNCSYYRYEILHGSFYIDGEEIRTPGSTLNHGPPNVHVVRIVLPGRIVLALKTLRPIKAGEEILHSYGPDNFAYSDAPAQLAPIAIKNFLKKLNPFSTSC